MTTPYRVPRPLTARWPRWSLSCLPSAVRPAPAVQRQYPVSDSCLPQGGGRIVRSDSVPVHGHGRRATESVYLSRLATVSRSCAQCPACQCSHQVGSSRRLQYRLATLPQCRLIRGQPADTGIGGWFVAGRRSRENGTSSPERPRSPCPTVGS